MRLLYKLLEIPLVYRLITGILGPGGSRLRKPYYQKVFRLSVARVLDVGCGPALNTPEPDGLLVGVDINESYIRRYTGGFLDQNPEWVLNPPSARRRLGFLASADALPFADGTFDEARSSSFFHHLSDGQANQALREISRCLKPGARMVIFEDVWPLRAWTRPLAWLIRRLDRGSHMRSESELLALLKKTCPGSWEWERFTYTYTGLECLCLQYVKP